MLYIKLNKINVNIKNQDYFSKNDLYINLIYGKERRVTTVKWNNAKPVWNEAFCFEYVKKQLLIIELYDSNKWSSDKKIYTCRFIPKYGKIVKENVTIFSITMGNINYDIETANSDLKNKNKELEKIINDKEKLLYMKCNENKSIKKKLDSKMIEIVNLNDQIKSKNNEYLALKNKLKMINDIL